MARLSLGKIPIDMLSDTVLKMAGAHSDQLVAGPKPGLDFAAIKLDRGFMVVSADPITGISTDIGWYAVNVAANDVATSGNRPQFVESVVLLPEGARKQDLLRIAAQMHRTAKELGITIVGGHTEVTPGLSRPIVIVTAFSFVGCYISSADAEEGDSLMMTKTAGLEGTVAIAAEGGRFGLGIPAPLAEKARRLGTRLSIVDEAVRGFKTGHVDAMHDCTEGGVLGAAYEMSLASGLGFVLRKKSVPVAHETVGICDMLSLDYLRLIGSGSVLLAVPRGKERVVKDALRPSCTVTTVGEFVKGRRVLIHENGEEERVNSAPEDELWRVLERTG